jgi:thiamine-phosphate pyrophosphorylase
VFSSLYFPPVLGYNYHIFCRGILKHPPFTRDLYIISDSVEVLKKAVEDGATIVQLRDKNADRAVVAEKAREMMAFKSERSFLFILNDDPEFAVECGADGVHVGQDMSTVEARAIVGPDKILGKTTHNLEQGRQAIADGADYISVGPVYVTPTKPGRPAVGLEYVRQAAKYLDIPFVAIGGIDLSNIDGVLEAGAGTIGAVRACTDAPEMLRRIKKRDGK